MSFTNLLTIAMPCYERKDYFKEALESALNQTVKCEIIVVDNCSSHDFFKQICKQKGVTYYRNETNIGLYPNVNRCFKLASTDYVKILDDDDLLLPLYVESFLKGIELYSDLDIFYTDYLLLNSAGESQHSYTLPFGYMVNGKKIIEYGINHNLGFPYMACTIKKTKIHTDIDIMGCGGGYDWEWIYSKADQLSFYGIKEKLYRFRTHNNQTSRKNRISHDLVIPYIYEEILLEKTTDSKLINKIAKKAFWQLIRLKSLSSKSEIRKLRTRVDNKYSNYLNEKLRNDKILRTIFILPADLVRLVEMTKRIICWLFRHLKISSR